MVKQAPFYHLYDAISAEEVCVLFKNTCLPFFCFQHLHLIYPNRCRKLCNHLDWNDTSCKEKLVCNSKHVHKFPSQYTKGNSQANIIELIVLTILNDIFTHFWKEK